MVHLRVQVGLHHMVNNHLTVMNLQADGTVPPVERSEAIKMDLGQEDLATPLLIDPNPVHRGMDT